MSLAIFALCCVSGYVIGRALARALTHRIA